MNRISDCFHRLSRFTGRRPPPVINRPRFRPSLEGLEAREVPASFTWIGNGSTDFDNLANWDEGGGAATRLPDAGDDLAFMSALYGNCDNMHGPASGSYSSVSLNGGYASTVTLIGGFTTASLTLSAAGAAISQPSPSGGYTDTDITVTSSFYFSDGTLNSDAHLSNLILNGATALIAPTGLMGGGTVYLGSNLVLSNGTELQISTGTVAAHNNPEVNMTGDNTTRVSLDYNDSLQITGVKQVNMSTNDHLYASSTLASQPATWNTNFPLYNNGGTVKLTNFVTVNFSGEAVVGGITESNTPYVQAGAGAKTNIESGSTLGVGANKWVEVRNGRLSTLFNALLPDTVANQTASITGQAYIIGGDVVICDGSSPHHYGTLYVSSDVVFRGGTYRPVVDVSLSGHCDVWKISGYFQINYVSPGTDTATIAVVSLGTPVASGSWDVIDAGTAWVYGNQFVNPYLIYDDQGHAYSTTQLSGGYSTHTFTLYLTG